MRRSGTALLALALACTRSAADHEVLGDREYAAGAYRNALAEYQLGLKANPSADLHAKAASAALHTGDYALAADQYVGLAGADRSRAEEAADGLERVVRSALAANDRPAAGAALADLRAVAPRRPLGKYVRLAALGAAERGDTAEALALLPSAVAAASDGRSADSLLFLYGMAAVRARPSYLDAAAMFGLACYLAGDGLAARGVWEELRERRPEDPRIEAYLALLDRTEVPAAPAGAPSAADPPPGPPALQDGGGREQQP